MSRDGEAAPDQTAEALGPEARLFPESDPVLFSRSLLRSLRAAARKPTGVGLVAAKALLGTTRATTATAARAAGIEATGPADGATDGRFDDPAWEHNPLFYFVRQTYGVLGDAFIDLIELGDTDPVTEEKARVYAQLLVDAAAPTNFLPTNPVALKQAFDTGGTSLLRGTRNLVGDIVHNNGMPQQVDRSAFELGEDLAATAGKVVFRNELMEVLQYEPRTETVHDTPLLLSPPWINKYYIMDLAPGRSFVEWAVEHGHTVFAISYRNPDESMRDATLEDYLIHGPRAAIDVVTEITGADRVNLVGLCLGGLMTALLAAYLDAEGDERVRTLTLLNTLLDFEEPGPLGTFTDEETVERLERKMAKRGYLEGSEMRGTFDILRANDLIFNYVVSNWLLGQDPPAFDILAWNEDSTRMPAQMHSFYLRAFYLENRFAREELELAGRSLRPADVTEDVFLVAAINDHIAPWKGSYTSTQLLGGDVKYVLSSSGHIAGIVNPPSPKAYYWHHDHYPADPEDWLAASFRVEGSWWERWAEWISERAGEQVPPPPMGSEQHPPRGDAPGTYVRG